MPKATPILNFGSINIDHVYRVPRIVAPGETLSSVAVSTGLGGKGANQSVAIAAAGGEVVHAGRLGRADRWALDLLAKRGVDISQIGLLDEPSGHAIIQLDSAGENAIIVHAGANQMMDLPALNTAFASRPAFKFLLLQNECCLLQEAIELAHRRGIPVVLNPAPMSDPVMDLPLNLLDTLVVNETEAMALVGAQVGGQADVQATEAIMAALGQRFPETRIVLTLGSSGATLWHGDEKINCAAPRVPVVDTTAAGDTFVGYFVAGLAQGLSNQQALERAVRAGATTVTRAGAVSSIPALCEVLPVDGD